MAVDRGRGIAAVLLLRVAALLRDCCDGACVAATAAAIAHSIVRVALFESRRTKLVQRDLSHLTIS